MKSNLLKHFFFTVYVLTACFACTKRHADNSLSVEAYKALGVPDPGSNWSMDDYTQAYNAMSKIKWEKPLQLPSKDSEKSGRLFGHMVSLEYLSFLKDDTMSLNEKANRISEFTRIYTYWMDVYTNPTLKRNHYHREIIDIQIFNLGITEAMLNLAHEINKSNDPADVSLQYGYNSIKASYLACLNNDLKTQSHTSEFYDGDLERMTDSIYNSAMRNMKWMDSSEVVELKHALRLVMDSTSSNYIREKYKSLETSLSYISH